METGLLRTFAVVVEHGSISAAALELGYVQSSVSVQLRRLESELGVALLVRSSTGVSPTAAGRLLIGEAAAVLDAEQRLRRTVRSPSRVRVGAVDTLAGVWLPAVAGALPADERPRVTMDRRDRLLRALVEDDCDVALLYRPVGAPLPLPRGPGRATAARFVVRTLDVDELVVVAAPDAATDAAGGDGWLVTQPGCVHREAFDRHVAARVADLRVEAEAPTPDGLRRLARSGMGRALLPRLAVADDLADGSLVVVADEDSRHRMEIVAVHHPDPGAPVERLLAALGRRPASAG